MSHFPGFFSPDETVRYLLTINPEGEVVIEEFAGGPGDMACGTAWDVFVPALQEAYPSAVFLPERGMSNDPAAWFDGAILWAEVADVLSGDKATARRRVYRAQAAAYRHAYMSLDRYLNPGPGETYTITEQAADIDCDYLSELIADREIGRGDAQAIEAARVLAGRFYPAFLDALAEPEPPVPPAEAPPTNSDDGERAEIPPATQPEQGAAGNGEQETQSEGVPPADPVVES